MRFAHLSDLHLSQTPVPGVLAEAEAIVEQIVQDVRRISTILDFVVVSGDMTDDAHAASFMKFETMLATIGLPVYIVPGNHDGPASYHQYRSRSETFAKWDITNRVVPMQDVRLLGIDTCIEGAPTGRIDAAAMALVEREVARPMAPPLVVVMHHPPTPPGLEDFDVVAQLDGSDALLDLLARTEMPATILSGHVHRTYQARSNGTSCFVAGSPTSAFTSDLPFGVSPIRMRGLQDFYFVHDVSRNGRHVVTPQHFSLATPPQGGTPT